jgi:putative transposase
MRLYARRMGRVARKTFPAYGVWHVTTRGVERRRVYLDRDDGLRFLAPLWRAVDRWELETHALCLMPNHYHLVVACLRDSLSQATQRVNGIYAETFNAKYRRNGHLWGDRFALWQVRDEEHLAATCNYVRQNPVRAGLVQTAAEWPWSWSRYESS